MIGAFSFRKTIRLLFWFACCTHQAKSGRSSPIKGRSRTFCRCSTWEHTSRVELFPRVGTSWRCSFQPDIGGPI